MSLRGFWGRLVRGSRWSYINDRYRDAVPADLDASVMAIVSRDRLHAKQGRSTARVVLHAAEGADSRKVSVYLKRHFHLPWASRLAATVDPSGRHSPAAAEFSHLERARALGVKVPEVVAAGERIGPWGGLQSYLAVAELPGRELNEILPELLRSLDPADFAAMKRRIVREMARIAATLHRARVFHKDLYLCHFFLDLEKLARDPRDVELTLIDLHRLREHRFAADRWRWKDLGQLLFSIEGVDGVEGRDVSRFWKHYRKAAGLRRPAWQARMIRLKAARYASHNKP